MSNSAFLKRHEATKYWPDSKTREKCADYYLKREFENSSVIQANVRYLDTRGS